jgi:hypothetical protein
MKGQHGRNTYILLMVSRSRLLLHPGRTTRLRSRPQLRMWCSLIPIALFCWGQLLVRVLDGAEPRHHTNWVTTLTAACHGWGGHWRGDESQNDPGLQRCAPSSEGGQLRGPALNGCRMPRCVSLTLSGFLLSKRDSCRKIPRFTFLLGAAFAAGSGRGRAPPPHEHLYHTSIFTTRASPRSLFMVCFGGLCRTLLRSPDTG